MPMLSKCECPGTPCDHGEGECPQMIYYKGSHVYPICDECLERVERSFQSGSG